MAINLRSPVFALLGWQQGLLAFLCIFFITLFAQLPFSYSFLAGKDQGDQSDAPFFQNFHAAESKDFWSERWRWSRSTFTLDVPGIGQRGIILSMNIVSHRAQWQQQHQPDAPVAPAILSLDPPNAQALVIPLRLHGARYHLYLPPDRLPNGRLVLHGSTESWHNPADRRDDLGVAIGNRVSLVSVKTDRLIRPDVLLAGAWAISLMLLWSALRVIGFSRTTSTMLTLPLALLIPALTLVEAPRLGAGALWAVQVSVMSLATAALCIWLIPPLLRRLHVLPPASLLHWLVLLVVVSFVMKYGGRLYPEAMPGDLQLHVNRALKTLQGNIYIEAQHRGLPFPFPNGPYLLLFPWMLARIDLRLLLQLALGIYEAATIVLLYTILVTTTRSMRMGVIAAAIYAVTAGGFMNTWFCFHTQVAAQFFSLLLLTLLIAAWPNLARWHVWAFLTMLFIQVFLGHIGLFINTSLVGVLIIPMLWWRTPQLHMRRSTLWLLGAGVASVAFVFLFYYSAFLSLIIEQTVGIATQGMNEVTGRDPIPRETTLQVIWEGGFITHFGFFPVALAIPGTILLSSGRLRSSILPPLIWLTFLVSASQAILPLITLNSITTRWLMFSSWAIAVTSSVVILKFWRHGLAGRITTLIMGSFVCWTMLEVYLAALALRQPPIEPF